MARRRGFRSRLVSKMPLGREFVQENGPKTVDQRSRYLTNSTGWRHRLHWWVLDLGHLASSVLRNVCRAGTLPPGPRVHPRPIRRIWIPLVELCGAP